jgi:signal peptidase II
MFKINLKKILLNFIIVSVIFLTDRISKIYILNIAQAEGVVDVYLTTYLNFYLIWNKGIAFGLLSFEENYVYNIISLIIALISIVILVMIIKNVGFKKYALIFILGGSLGNLFDRVYYSAVPDFIDLHINSFHWFIFNIADIFITIGVICLIYDEIFFNKRAIK